jgi:hypothetical protein
VAARGLGRRTPRSPSRGPLPARLGHPDDHHLATVGFAGLIRYPHLVADFERSWGPSTYSVFALGLRLGLTAAAAHLLLIAVGGSILLGGLARERRGQEEAAFKMIIVAAVLLSAIVWLHYLALFLVPVALLRPRFSLIWLAPLLLWLCPDGLADPSWYPVALLVASAIVLTIASVPERPPKAQAAPPARRWRVNFRPSQDPA